MRVSSVAAVIERIEDSRGFEKLREEWTELLEASASNCLFLTWEWLYTWWKHLSAGRRLFIIAVRCGRELIAIAPLTLRPPRLKRLLPFSLLEFLGTESAGSDYLDLIIRRGKEEEAMQALANYLADGKLMLELAHLKRNSSFAAELAAQLRQRGWSLCEAKTTICPFRNFSGHSWESYLTTLSHNLRNNFRRRIRNLSKHFNVRFEQVRSEGQRREALAQLVALHNLRWRDRGGSDAFHTPQLLAFHEELSQLALKHGWLRLFVLRLDGIPVASLYGFKYQRTFYQYQNGFDPSYGKQGVGQLSIGLTIKSAIEEAAEDYDFLRGDESYKFDWAREVRELGRLDLYPPGVCGLLYKGAMGLSRAARRMARRVLPKTLADRIVRGRGLPFGNGRYAAATR